MPHDRLAWLRRIQAVEREHSATRLAADRLLDAADHDPTVLGPDLRLRDVRLMTGNLDGTYVIRLFAEFETGLRSFWPTARATDPPSRTRDLLDGVAATCRVPDEQRGNAQAVRDYRNSLVHERDEPTVPIPIAMARSHLCRFLSYLPPAW